MREHKLALRWRARRVISISASNFTADSSIMTLIEIAQPSRATTGQSAFRAGGSARRYSATGEINFQVDDKDGDDPKARRGLLGRRDRLRRWRHGPVSRTGGSTSARRNTEPLLRLVLEARIPGSHEREERTFSSGIWELRRRSLHISPTICCGRESAAICGVCSRRAAQRTVKYASAALRSQPPHLTTAFRPRDESW